MSADEKIYFTADDLFLCAGASSVHRIHDGLITQPEADTQPWFLGLAVVDGRLLPVTDLGAYYGKKPSAGRIIEVAHRLGNVGLQVDDVHSASVELPVAINEYQVIDIAQLVQSEQFLDIQCNPA